MKKQNDIIRNLEAMTEVRGGTVEVTRYRYIREAIVEMKFGRGITHVGIGCVAASSIVRGS